VGEDPSGLAEIPLDHGDRGMLAGEQGPAVRQHDRLIAHVREIAHYERNRWLYSLRTRR
jgi:predicted aconitase